MRNIHNIQDPEVIILRINNFENSCESLILANILIKRDKQRSKQKTKKQIHAQFSITTIVNTLRDQTACDVNQERICNIILHNPHQEFNDASSRTNSYKFCPTAAATQLWQHHGFCPGCALRGRYLQQKQRGTNSSGIAC